MKCRRVRCDFHHLTKRNAHHGPLGRSST
jgi:hypothetical protein